ncbi:MAG: gliding motility-associated C-terminal domain-containing protein [Lewinellaceae bacterium]|nr:gliding motility-associated C-terminal domain-containing protein [Lewinellaceae bacterium]
MKSLQYHLSSILIICFLFIWNFVSSQQTIATSLPGCLPIADMQGINCGGGATFFGINGSNQFQVQNIDGLACCPAFGGGDGESYFEFQEVNIACYTNVSVSIDYSAGNTAYEDDSPSAPIFGCQGTLFPDNSHDQIVFTYSIDGGAEVQDLYVHGTSQSDFTGTWTISGLSGSTLRIRVYASNKSQQEIFYFSNLQIMGTLDAMVGTDQTICSSEMADLTASCPGTWSGGSGVFADANSANTTYTPDASETGSTIVLTYTLQSGYPGCPTSDEDVNITIMDDEDATFIFSDFCANEPNGATGIITPGGTFSFNPNPGDGATINSTTGEISNAVGGSSYTVQYTTNGTCPGTSTVTVNALDPQDATFDFADFCAGSTNGPSGIITPGGTFSFNPDPGGGVTINPSTGVISGAVGGDSYTVEYTTNGTCPATHQVTVNILDGPSASISGSATLCPGQCASFSFNFVGGSGTYDLQILASPPGFSFSVPGVTASSVFNICYTGVLPTYDSGSMTLNIPTSIIGSGTLSLTGITDVNGCTGTASGSYNLTLTGSPTANSAGPLTVCPEPNGDGIFDLTSLETTILGGTSGTVLWWTNSDGTGPISNPSNFLSGNTTVYATIDNGNCESAPVPIDLNILNNQPNFLNMICAASQTNQCDLCVTDMTADLGFLFGDNDSYEVTVLDNSTGQVYTGIVNNGTTLQVNVNGSTTFELQSVQIVGGCPNSNTFGDQVTINIIPTPLIDDPDIQPACNFVVLPDITGQNLSPNVGYFTDTGGNGTQYFAGQQIFTDGLQLYIYDNVSGCMSELPITIEILPQITYNPISDTVVCSSYMLPAITGTGVTSEAAYYFSPIAGTPHFFPGTIIDTSATFTIFDPNVDQDCVEMEQVFTVTIADTVKTPIVAVNCALGEGMGQLIVFTPFGGGYSFQIDTFPFQKDSIFSNLVNKTYKITARNDTSGCVSKPAIIDVNCGCNLVQTLNINQINYTTCAGNPITLNNVNFTNSPNITVVSNGQGTLNQASFSTSPAKIVYQPHQNDIGKTVVITISTADPDGLSGPCAAISEQVTILVAPNPTPTISGPSTVCVGSTLTLQASNAVSYNWSSSEITQTITLLNVMVGGIASVTVTDANGCKGSAMHTYTVGQISAGQDNMASVCIDSISTINLVTMLDPNANSGGTWKYLNGSIDPAIFDFSTLAEGNHLFSYIISDPSCGNDTAVIAIEILGGNFAGNDNQIKLCASSNQTIDISAALGPHDAGGHWIIPPSLDIDLTNLSAAKITNPKKGLYNLSYIADAKPCKNDIANIVITIEEFLSSGQDVNPSICKGAVINLQDYVATTPGKGRFVAKSTVSGFDGQNWDTTSEGVGTYTFYHITDNVSPCQPDTSLLNFKISASLSAGSNATEDVCAGSTIVLSDYLSADADAGGKFYINGILVPNGNYTVPVSGSRVVIDYEIGDDIICPKDKSTITLNILQKQNVSLMNRLDFCEKNSGTFTLPSGLSDGVKLYFTIKNSGKYSANVTLSPQNRMFIFENDNSKPLSFLNLPLGNSMLVLDSIAYPTGCTFAYGLTSDINVNSILSKDIDLTLCSGETLKIGSDTYSETKPSGTTVVQNLGKCDSIYNVSLKFYPVPKGRLDTLLCSGSQSLTIGGQIFNLTRPSGTVTLSGASVHGCDSLVNVQLTFGNGSITEGLTEVTTCDDRFFIEINGIRFDKNNPSGSVTLAGASYLGCDSIHKVNIIFDEFISFYKPSFDCVTGKSVLLITGSNGDGPYDIRVGNDLYVGVSLPYSAPIFDTVAYYRIVSSDGCIDSDTLTFGQSWMIPSIDVSSSVITDGLYQLITTGDTSAIYDYTWTGTDLSCQVCFDPIATPNQTITYVFTYHFGDDCVDSEQLSIIVDTENIVIPNIFSPNGDGKNDKFLLTIPKKFVGSIASVTIFDRWGNIVYDVLNPELDDGWDGTMNGRPAEMGVYVYIIKLKDTGVDDGNILSGDVTLLR